MQQKQCVVALFKDEDDAFRWEAFLDHISTVLCITAGQSLVESLQRICGREIHPGVVIFSSRLYPERPELAAQVREYFPDAEFLLVSSSEDPAPPLQPLVQDKVRHLAITPASGDRTAKDYFESVLQRLVSGRPWEIGDCLLPRTPLATFEPASSDEKEAIIAALEEAIEGDTVEHELLRQQGALLADELLENAIYGAPRGCDLEKLFEKGEIRRIPPEEGIRFRFGFDGRTLALEMTDGWGTLSPEQVLEYLSRNQQEEEMDEAGGRGLFIIWRFFDHFHVTITPGEKTVVSGDLQLCSEPDPEAPRGFHITTHTKEAWHAV